MDFEKGQFQFAAIQWLFDMELVDDPQLINTLKLNILSTSEAIQEVELLTSQQHRQMLIYVELKLTWFQRTFFQKRILDEVERRVTERVRTLLPRFRVRVVNDRRIMNLAIEKVKFALTGSKPSETKTDVSSSPVIDPSSTPSGGV